MSDMIRLAIYKKRKEKGKIRGQEKKLEVQLKSFSGSSERGGTGLVMA